MASRCRSISRPAQNFLKSAMNKPSGKSIPSTRSRLLSPTFPRLPSEMGGVLSLLPFHSAVSSARLTSCLGMDLSCRSRSQGMLCRANPGV
ncbi:protein NONRESPONDING TO OXYLIPINS 2, mitochondrial-like [Macadamia integrifolia]|uniref:protein NONRESPONDING TO OXYLIPINS 2, mitochondrial-like n=1 Tax=Macadamia integrifolia TaxID=60698 RepID=UPI001C50058C|nr:protein NONRESPONDING TO OXYLIPINS 2, mitochondrial-like isoform X1 [Macadamia integrifolia]XP_042484140.1 protein NONRESPONDING TO OXYLIPINS 2, mitochondrial-like isoform X1 [Macadamia integrifolia]XP_042488130.1 protein NONRESPONDING TO OXYLIPINS 2, mitochondrial-like [Macadamia integrifolia]